ncbi:MAG: alpha/beta fold hydrolase [Acetobacteraceae bacterium]|nr:alpha/beta fold hydrolase [Acetobacteraceae bacterium]
MALIGRILTALLMMGGAAVAATYPEPVQGDYVAHDFHFHDGTVMKELKLHYTTVGAKTGEPVLMLHGTAGTGTGLLSPAFAGELFGPGQPLDASKYYIILPDVIGAGQSTKPSDGMRAGFPRYDYDDMVAAQHEMLTQGLGIHHLRLVMGNSMGGMETWVWGEKHPDFMDALVPMASQPTAMSSRNWMMRRMIIDAVRTDPAWKNGNYTEQPPNLKVANVWFGIATSGGNSAYAKEAPTRAAADAELAKRQAAPFTADANDFMYQWDASRDYDAEPDLDKITAPVLVINSADDERNPPETGVMDKALKHLKNARYYLIPESAETRGHGTTSMAKFYQKPLAEFLAEVPKRGS